MIPFKTLKQYPAQVEKPSPNYSLRTAPNLLVIILHATAGSDAGAESWMTSKAAQVSAHLHIRRDGTVVRLVNDKHKAWHAGVSRYEGKGDVNQFSIGIEIGNKNDGKEAYTEAQYRAVAEVIKHYRAQGGVDVKSHYDIAPGRKNDPKGFDYCHLWEVYGRM